MYLINFLLPLSLQLFFCLVCFGEVKVTSEENSLPIYSWVEDSKDNFKKLRSLKTPVLIQGNLPLKHWKAMKKWNDNSYLLDKVSELSGVCIDTFNDSAHQFSFSFYDLDAPINQLSSAEWKQPFESVDMSMADFLQAIQNGQYRNETASLYYSNRIVDVGKLYNDVHPLDPMMPRHFELLNDKQIPINVWISNPGVFARAHYDSSSNLFIQIRGTKRFLLVDPKNWDAMHLFSHLHPLTRHSQFNPANPNEALQFPGMSKVLSPNFPGTYQVDLKPGDVLYLPAFYFHQVHVLPGDISISINTYVDEHQKEHFRKIYGVPMPFTKKMSHDLKETTLYFFLRETVKTFRSKLARNDPTLYIRKIATKILNTRWQHAWRDPVLRDWIMLPNLGTVICPDPVLSKDLAWDNIQDTAEAVSDYFMAMKPYAVKVCFPEYIEGIANKMTTDLRLMGRFIRRLVYCQPRDFGFKKYH